MMNIQYIPVINLYYYDNKEWLQTTDYVIFAMCLCLFGSMYVDLKQ